MGPHLGPDFLVFSLMNSRQDYPLSLAAQHSNYGGSTVETVLHVDRHFILPLLPRCRHDVRLLGAEVPPCDT